MKLNILSVDTMKILQVVQFFSPNHGGSATSPYELSKQLQKKGHEITVLTTDFQMNNVFIDSLEGITVIPFHCQFNIGGLLISSSMNKYLKENIDNFDIIHMHNFRTYQNIITRKYAIRHNVPYILQARGSVLPFFQKQKLKKIFDIFFGYKILHDASKFIALTKTEAEQYTKMGIIKDKIEIIPNGINLKKYENLPIRGMFRKKYGIKDNEKLILYLGRIHKIKGIGMLVDAFSKNTQKSDQIKLIIAGPDDGFISELHKQVESLNINDKVIFTGPLYEQDKLEAYIDSDIYVLPSISECFPNTILEACACGISVIVTTGCGIKDIVEDNCGYVVNDENSLSEALVNLLTNENLRIKFGEKGCSLVKEKFTWDQVVNEMETLYEKCISS